MSVSATGDRIRQDCWTQALYSYGTAWLFERKSRSLKRRLRILAFLGVAGPVAIGGIVLSFGTNPDFLPVLLSVASVLGVFQLLISIWALVANWDEAYAHSIESMNENYRLSDRYRELASNPPAEVSELERRVELVRVDDRRISDLDRKQGVSEKEKRRGMRAALRQFQRRCAGCGKVPSSMESSDCDVCGRF